MKILFCASEVFPFSKTGGLGDIASFLPKAIKSFGNEIKIISPYYNQIKKYHDQMTFLGQANLHISDIDTIVNYYELIHEGVSIIFVQSMHYFERDRLYGYEDDALRFACFNYAILEGLNVLNYYPDILHLNDWQTGMIPYLLDKHYRPRSFDYYKIRTLLTIHNLEYQGVFDTSASRYFNTDFNYDYIHFDNVNYLKAGIYRATKINTVSPTYRNETTTLNYGFTLDGALRNRNDDYIGILNGIDYSVFNPKTDPSIDFNYDINDFTKVKFKNKNTLQDGFGLEVTDLPLIGFVGRLAHQKGIDLMRGTLEDVLNNSNAQIFLMGSGDETYEQYFKELAHKYPGRVGTYIGYNESLAHKIYASSDIFLMPSLFEPCGLGQMIAMRYGSLPIVRETGGLKDTVEPYNKYTQTGTGFSFKNYQKIEFKDQIFAAIDLYNNEQKVFNKLVKNAMNKNYSTEAMACAYIELYKKILEV